MDINANGELILENETSEFGIFTKIVLSPLVLSFTIACISFLADKTIDFSGIFLKSYIVLLTLFGIFGPKSIRNHNNEIKKAKKLNNYFKSKFHIINEFNPEKYENLGIAYAEEEKSTEVAMFKIYKDAYKAKADAIVLNSSTTNTHVSGSVKTERNVLMSKEVSGSTSSYNTVNIMATLVKYKNTKIATPLKKEELEIEDVMA